MNSDSKDFETVIKIRNDNDLQLLKNIYAYGWSEMSLAQQVMLPKLLDKEYDDVSFQYPSGMGKSGVYILTLLYNMDYNDNCICGLIVLPTRELANQVYTDCVTLTKRMNVNICKCVGKEEVTAVNPDYPTIVVGTCGKIIDFMYKKNCRFFNQKCDLKYLVIDEADNFFLDMYNHTINNIEIIVKNLCNENTHILAISATFNKNVREFIRNKLMRKNNHNIEEYLDDSEVTLTGITQYYVDLTNIVNGNSFKYKIDTLLDIIPVIGVTRGIIFVNSASHAQQVYSALIDENYTCEVIYGRMSQDERNTIMHTFMKSGINFLIATDLISRGIDFKDIAYVIQLELPQNEEDYIHRIGRSGRYGKVGTAINIICGKDEKRDLDILVKKYEIDMHQFEFN